jgi:hypothetical protein
MKPLLAILSKYLVLFSIIAVSAVFIFSSNIGYKEINYFFAGLGLLYVIICCVEAEVIAAIDKGTRKYIYFTASFVSKRFIKVVFFVCAGGILLFPHNIIRYLSFVCFLIAFTEIVLTLWRYARKLCFVAFEGNKILLSTNKIVSVHAAGIEKIEKRHGITYFVYENSAAITLRTDMMKERDGFDAALSNWIRENHLEDKVVASS